jgi:cell division protein FtsN
LARADMAPAGNEMSKASSWLFSDGALIIGIALGMFAVLIGMVVFRHTHRKRRRKSSSSSRSEEALQPEEDDETPGHIGRRRKKRRHRRREHRGRNPTLAETGGLPPGRSENKSESA